MASSYKTENLKLTQFAANDRPSWLTDYNNDMEKIDAAFGSAVNEKVDEALAHLSESIDGIVLYQHEKVGTVHCLTNPTGGGNIKFVATATFVEGDSFEVNGVAATVNGSPAFEAGKTVLAFYDSSSCMLSVLGNVVSKTNAETVIYGVITSITSGWAIDPNSLNQVSKNSSGLVTGCFSAIVPATGGAGPQFQVPVEFAPKATVYAPINSYSGDVGFAQIRTNGTICLQNKNQSAWPGNGISIYVSFSYQIRPQ